MGADDYTAQLIEDLKNPVEAAAYLEAALEEGDREALLVAMRHVAAAHGGMTAIAQQTGLSQGEPLSGIQQTGQSDRGDPFKCLGCNWPAIERAACVTL
ncbi:hypothetical protein LP417_31895 [Polaromonas sp. P1-6]|nr:hypothetical protein LP417_31895 [Polaromonas sp. P1-6]